MRLHHALLFAFLLSASIATAAEADPLYHVLAKGETVYSLAKMYKVSVDSILQANGIADPTKIRVGQRLLIPRTHTVAKGETLFSIGRLYAVSVADLRNANHLAASAVIVPGQVLLLPGSAVAPTARASASAASPAASVPASSSSAVAVGGPGPAGTAAPAKQPGAPSAAMATKSAPDNAGAGQSAPSVSGSPGAPYPPLVKTSSKAVDPSLVWPCSGEARYLDGKIDGIMILTERGVASRAIAAGRVVSAGPYRGFGQVVFVEARTGIIYVYGGNDSLQVKVGDTVRSGQDIGQVGYDSKEGRAVAYFFAFRNGQSLDPATVPRG
jgi:lipoprotein NlpD